MQLLVSFLTCSSWFRGASSSDLHAWKEAQSASICTFCADVKYCMFNERKKREEKKMLFTASRHRKTKMLPPNSPPNLHITDSIKADGQRAFLSPASRLREMMRSSFSQPGWRNTGRCFEMLSNVFTAGKTCIVRTAMTPPVVSGPNQLRGAGSFGGRELKGPSKCSSRTVERLPGGEGRRGKK